MTRAIYLCNEYTTNWKNSGVLFALVMFRLFMHCMSVFVYRTEYCRSDLKDWTNSKTAAVHHQHKWLGLCFLYYRKRVSSCNITYVAQKVTQLLLWLNIYSQYVWVVPQPSNVWTHRATHNPHIPNYQHTVYRRSWRWTCRSETCRAVKHIVNKYSTITKVVYLVGLHM